MLHTGRAENILPKQALRVPANQAPSAHAEEKNLVRDAPGVGLTCSEYTRVRTDVKVRFACG